MTEQCPATTPYGGSDRQCSFLKGHRATKDNPENNHRSYSLSAGDVEWPNV